MGRRVLKGQLEPEEKRYHVIYVLSRFVVFNKIYVYTCVPLWHFIKSLHDLRLMLVTNVIN